MSIMVIFNMRITCVPMSFRIVTSIYDKLEPLIQLDPLLLYGFVFVCPKKELTELCRRVLPFISMSFLAKVLLLPSKQISKNDVSSHVS